MLQVLSPVMSTVCVVEDAFLLIVKLHFHHKQRFEEVSERCYINVPQYTYLIDNGLHQQVSNTFVNKPYVRKSNEELLE